MSAGLRSVALNPEYTSHKCNILKWTWLELGKEPMLAVFASKMCVCVFCAEAELL